ncbi:hypothetical protein [Lysinibacillus xylanilyticus]|uniref:hypothetical protein n=1 Tax=Lysinibacillus xylanilyticus TaxID=582475 RepID=UPI003CFC2A5C
MQRNGGSAPEKQGLLFSTRKRSATQRRLRESEVIAFCFLHESEVKRSGSANRSAVQRNGGYAKAKRRYSVEPYILETNCK